MDRDGPVTEARRAGPGELDLLSSSELVALMNELEAEVPTVVAGAAAHVSATVDEVVTRLRAGGRLVYVGAGSSGRQALADAAECRATFSADPGQVVAAFAGDDDAVEDDAAAGAEAMRGLGVGPLDAVVAISASGSTPYVLGAAEAAVRAGAFTACVVSSPGSPLAELVEREIAVVVGPELIAGSTRLRAATAQKLVLNQLSTVSMVRLGKVYGDLMVDVAVGNRKLRERARRIVEAAAGVGAEQADEALAAADGSVKVAIVSLLAGLSAEDARARLEAAGGAVRPALAEETR